MKKAEVFMHGKKAGLLLEVEKNDRYRFSYSNEYSGPPISVTMPVEKKIFEYSHFPPFFEGLLPEGVNLEMLLRIKKIDRNDSFAQLIAVGKDTVGAVTVREANE